MNLFIHHRDIRWQDNTTLNNMFQQLDDEITPIFIFPPEQIDPKKNKYFSNNLVQFMCQSLQQLNKEYKDKGGELYFFEGDNLDILKKLNKKEKINSIGFNLDYSPYAKIRDEKRKKGMSPLFVSIYLYLHITIHANLYHHGNHVNL